MIAYGSGLPDEFFLPNSSFSVRSYLWSFFGKDGLAQASQQTVFVILGQAIFAVSKAPLAAMILVTEMIGDLSQLLTIGIVLLAADLTMDLLGGESVYEAILAKMLPVSLLNDEQAIMIEWPIIEDFMGK